MIRLSRAVVVALAAAVLGGLVPGVAAIALPATVTSTLPPGDTTPPTSTTNPPTTTTPTVTETTQTVPPTSTTSTVALPDGPANDDFASATVITALPFSAPVDTADTTREPGEPLANCQHDLAGTVWFSYTAETDAVLLFDTGYYSSVSAVYTGNTLTDLAEVACTDYQAKLAFSARAGTTYWFQTGEHPPGWGAGFTVTLAVAPPPELDIYTSPTRPSRYDQVSFNSYVTDPANGQVRSWEWDLGDGTVSRESWPLHRYAADGDYPVTLTVTMEDGRTASATDTVQVRTHDVEIAAFAVPDTGRVGQSRPITVEVSNTAYPEVVTVELYRSVAGSYQEFERFGQLTQSVPARPNRTVTFPFAYTFTDEDLVVGKVTFKAVAVLGGGAHDALPADNTVIAPATRVRPARLV